MTRYIATEPSTSNSCLTYLLVVTLTGALFCFLPAVSGQEDTSISVVPSQITVDATKVEYFNMTIWVYDVSDLFAYQVFLQVNDSVASISRAWNPRSNSSWVFYGKTTMPTDPVFYDIDRNGRNEEVKIGESMLFGDPTFTGARGLLGIIEFHVEHGPAQTVLSIDSSDTYLLDSSAIDEIPAAKNNGQLKVEGKIEEKHQSRITISANPLQVIEGENVTLTGEVAGIEGAEVHPRSDVDVTIQRSVGGSWANLHVVKTNGTGYYRYMWLTDVEGTIKVRSKWEGDETFKGNISDEVTVEIVKVSTRLEITFADPDQEYLGGPVEPLPTVPGTFNVTVMNVTDLYMWKTKFYFDPFILKFGGAWHPADNVFYPNYTASPVEIGSDDYGSYIIMSANLTDGEGFTGDGTLFQMNFTGLRPTVDLPPNYLIFSTDYGDRLYTYLRNSTGYNMPFIPKELAVTVEGELYAEISVMNPETGEPNFNFHVEDFPVGSRFNATIVIRSVLNMSGWIVKLSFNNTLLSPVKVFHPTGSVDYVFYGLPSINDTIIGEDYLKLQDILPPGETPVNVGTDQKLLTVVQFEIIYAPPAPENASELERVTTILDLAHGETSYLSEGTWLPVNTVYGIYSYGYSLTSSDGGGGSILDYWPYFLIVLAAIVIVATVLMRRRGREVYEEEYLDEKYLEEEYLE